MTKRFEFPDGTALETPEDTSLEEAVLLFEHFKTNPPKPPPPPEPGPSLLTKALTLPNEFAGEIFRQTGRTLRNTVETLEVQRRNIIDKNAEFQLDLYGRLGKLTPERETKIKESAQQLKFKGPAAFVANSAKMTGQLLVDSFAGVPEEIERASVVTAFEEEGFGPAAGLLARKAPGVLGQQVVNIGLAYYSGGKLSATPLMKAAAPALMKNAVFKRTLGAVSERTLAAGATAGLIEGSATVHQAIERGASDEQISSAFVEMFVGTAFLNTIGMEQFFRKVPKGALSKLTRAFLTAGAEGLTEGLEEFVEADALDRAGIEKFDFKQTLRQAIEAALFGVLVGGVIGGSQQVFSPETRLELGAKEIGELGKTFEKKILGKVTKLTRAEPGTIPRPVDEEGNPLYRMPDETFEALTDMSRLPGQSIDREAAAHNRAVIESITVVLAESKGISPEQFMEEYTGELGLFEIVGEKPLPSVGSVAAKVAQVEVATESLTSFFTGKNRSLDEVLDTIASDSVAGDTTLVNAVAVLKEVAGFEIGTFADEKGIVQNEEIIARLSEIGEQLEKEATEEAVRVSEEVITEQEKVEEEGLPQPALPSPLAGVPTSEVSSSETLRLQDDSGLRSDEEMAEDIGAVVTQYRREISAERKKLGKASLDKIAETISIALDEVAVLAVGTNKELKPEDINASVGSWLEGMTRLSRDDNTPVTSILKRVHITFAEIIKRKTPQMGVSLNLAKKSMEEAILAEFDNSSYLQNMTLTPDGKNISLLTADIAARTRTKSFKNWFGNSKVVDVNGEPLIVFHGTKVIRFDPVNEFFPLSHFGTSLAAWDIIKHGVKEGRNITQSFLKIENPLEMEDTGPFDDAVGTGEILKGLFPHRTDDIANVFPAGGKGEANIALAKIAQEEGFDGATYINQHEDKGSTSWVIFEPTQAKSPLNRGTYSLKDGNVLYSREEGGTIRGQLIGLNESGAVKDIREASKFLIRAFQSSNISTAYHEMAHFAALTSGGQLKADIEAAMLSPSEKEAGKTVKVEDWSKNRHERFARSFEKYMLLGIPPAKQWEKTFYIIKEKLALAYQTMRNYVLPLMDPELARVFDHFFLHYGPGKALGEFNESLNQIDKLMGGRDEFGTLSQKTGDSIRTYFNNVNITPYANDPEMKKVIIEILDRLGGIERVSDAEVMSKALDLLDTKGGKHFIRDVQKFIDQGNGLDDVEILAAAIIKNRLEATVYNLITKGRGNTEEFKRAIAELTRVLQVQQEAGNFLGRSLRMMKSFGMGAEETMEFLDQIADADPALIEQLERMDITRPEEINRVLKQLNNSGVKILISAYLNGLLSGPKTLGVNFFSTMLHIASIVPVRLGAAAIENRLAKHQGRAPELYMKEGWFLFTSLFTTPKRKDGAAWKAAWGALTARGGLKATSADLRKLMTKYDEITGHSIIATWDVFFDGYDSSKSVFTPKGLLGAFARWGRDNPKSKSTFIYTATAPTRLLFAFDVWMKAIPEFSEATAITYRLGKSGVELINGEITNESILDAHIEREKKMLGSTYEDLLKKREIVQELRGSKLTGGELKRAALIESYSKRRAEEGAFQTAPAEHSLTGWAVAIKQKHPLMGTIFYPFVKTLSNVAHVTTEYVPGAPILEAQIWDRATSDKQGVFARTMPAELVAKQMFGLFVFLMIWKLFDDEDRLTGPSPESQEERESWIRQGKPDWSIRFGDTWYEYRRFEPFGTVLSLAANFFTDLRRLEEDKLERAETGEPDRDLFEKFWFVTRDIADVFMNGHWAQGAMDMVSIVTATATEREAKRTFARTASGMIIPASGFFRWVNSIHNQELYGGTPVEDDASIADYISRSAPFSAMFYSQREPGIDGLGQKIVRQSRGDFLTPLGFAEPESKTGRVIRRFLTNWTPFNYTILRPDRVEQQLIDTDLYPGTPLRKLQLGGRFGKRYLDEDIYVEYITQAGHNIKEDIERRLRSLEKMDPERKKRRLKQIIDRARKRPRLTAIREQRKRIRERGES